jgi:Ca2+-binding EF-hand superfamily protein
LKLEIHGNLADIEPLFFEEILGEDGYVNLSKFTDICDLFHYLPIHKKIDKNDSKNLCYIMSSNCYGKFNENIDQGGYMKKFLDLLWLKISDKFNTIAEAYRYFDVNFNGRVSFNEF